MGLQAVPGFIYGGGTFQHPAELMRNLVEGIVGVGAKGLLAPGGFTMTPSGSVMQLTVGLGYAVIAGEESTTQGSYFLWSNASEVLAWPAHSAQARWDTLVMRAIDKQYGADTNPEGAMWEICQGTPAGSPTKIPDVEFQSGGDFYRPGAWWRVADVLVEATDTNMAATTIVDMKAMANSYSARGEVAYAYQQTVQFTANGTFTKANYPLARKIRVKVQAPGGGGGGSGTAAASQSTSAGGGGGGGYAESFLDVATLASTITVTVPAGGAGGSAGAGNNGTGASAASFGSLVAASGGSGGTASGSGQSSTASIGLIGGPGGAGTAGDLQLAGEGGGTGWKDGALAAGGTGGSAQLGGGAVGTRIGAAAALAGVNAGNYGGGGSGSCAGNTATGLVGGNGGPAIVLVEIYA